VDVKTKKAQNLLWACRRACRARWALRLKMAHWLHVAIVLPIISFAFLLWWPGCQTASARKKLSKVQKLACLRIMGGIRTTPTGAFEALVGLPPLNLVIQGGRGRRHIASGVWGVGLTFTPIKDIVTY